jgi:hypothetical protein
MADSSNFDDANNVGSSPRSLVTEEFASAELHKGLLEPEQCTVPYIAPFSSPSQPKKCGLPITYRELAKNRDIAH